MLPEPSGSEEPNFAHIVPEWAREFARGSACHSSAWLPGRDTVVQKSPGSAPDSKSSVRPEPIPTVTVKLKVPDPPESSVQLTVKRMSWGSGETLPIVKLNGCGRVRVAPGAIGPALGTVL